MIALLVPAALFLIAAVAYACCAKTERARVREIPHECETTDCPAAAHYAPHIASIADAWIDVP